jgi:phytoene synthase
MPDALTPEVRAALNDCREIITKGSKSFSLAAKLFDAQTRDAAVFLYGWCRYCDDQVDEASKADDRLELEGRLKALKEKTASAFSFAPQQAGEVDPSGGAVQRDPSLGKVIVEED